jgi:hypothetical protein
MTLERSNCITVPTQPGGATNWNGDARGSWPNIASGQEDKGKGQKLAPSQMRQSRGASQGNHPCQPWGHALTWQLQQQQQQKSQQ